MPTAQMTQAAPRMVNDIHPPTAAAQKPLQPISSTEIEIINDLPVQKQMAQKSIAFNPIMSAEHNHPAGTADHLLSQVNHAVKVQHAQPDNQKSQPVAIGPKPVLETVLLIIACLVACAAVLVVFSNN